jgi:hypothetical protein
MTIGWGRTLAPRAAALAIACALPVAGCSLLNGPAIIVSASPSATASSPSPSVSPSPSPSPSATASPSPTSTAAAAPSPAGPIQGAPAGTPVKPEVFLATVDAANGVLRVVADVPGIYEDGGTCTVKVTAGATVVQKHSTGASDVSSTACGQFVFSLSDLPSGTASIVASYQSTAHSGSSGATKVTIP